MTTAITTLTKYEAIEVLAAHTAFANYGGERSDDWFAGRNEYDYPCAALRLSQIRHAEHGTKPRKARYVHSTHDWDQREYALPTGESPLDVLIEALDFGSRDDWFNADDGEISDALREMIEEL